MAVSFGDGDGKFISGQLDSDQLDCCAMTSYNDKQKIIEHYDAVSPYYRDLWGEHLHHGYWPTGSESKEQAQLALTAHLAETAKIQPGAAILDVGCGYGGSSVYLSSRYQAQVTGITISPVQVEMARQAAERAKVPARFLVMDADNITLTDRFDVAWSVEAISHFTNTADFFVRTSELLKPGGTLALIDWFKQEDLSPEQYKSFIKPIEQGMFVQLKTVKNYLEMIRAAGLEVVDTSDLSEGCARTWDLTLDIIKNPRLWQLASELGTEFVRFLKAFKAMKRGFSSGNFVYAMIVARKK